MRTSGEPYEPPTVVTMAATATKPEPLAPPAPRRRSAGSAWLRVCGRLANPAVVFGALWIAAEIRGLQFGIHYEALGIVACLTALLVFNGMGLNRSRWRTGTLIDLGSLFVAWATTASILLALGYVTKSTADFSRVALSTWFVLVLVLLCVLHLAVWSYFRWLRRRGVGSCSAVLAPLTPAALRLAAAFRADASFGVAAEGFFDDEKREPTGGMPWLGRLLDLPDYVRRNGIQAVYVSLEQPGVPALPRVLEGLQGSSSSIYLIPNLFSFDLLSSEWQSVGGIPVLAVGGAELGEFGGVLKRAMDAAISAAALALLSPLLLVVAVAIKVDSPGPVIFKQKRYGLNGDEITVWKFRSMSCLDNDRRHVHQAVRADRRVTSVGAWLRRTSVDELPQLWNVLRGSMSLVGPRPHAVAHNEFYREKIRGYMLRHRVRPGMTGWAQVNGLRGQTETLDKMQRRLDYDLEYVRRWTPVLDLWILLRTVPALLSNRDVY